MYTSVITVEELAKISASKDTLIVDCRYSLGDGEAGRKAYLESHIAAAIYADTGQDLSSEPVTDKGRHPLPDEARLKYIFSRMGITARHQVIAYDDSGGAFAARLWWLLRYMGHTAVAVLDGGWQAWTGAAMDCESGWRENPESQFEGEANRPWLVRLEQVNESALLVDSREPARFLGEEEPIDPVAGHIPGALNRCWKDNLSANGRFLSPAQLQTQFLQLYGKNSPDEVVFYCGSGVTACHNLLAVEHAELPPARLYAGSWSEWCQYPELGVELGVARDQR